MASVSVQHQQQQQRPMGRPLRQQLPQQPPPPQPPPPPQQQQVSWAPPPGPSSSGRRGGGSLAGDTEISFGSLGDESVVAAAPPANGSAVPDDLVERIGMAEFSSEEKFQLDNLLQRVHAAQDMDERHKERLRQQLQAALTQASSVQEGLHSGLLYKMCELCGGKLYPFHQRFVCQRCSNLACAGCIHQLHGGSQLQCRLCHLEFQTEAQTGEWFLAEVRRRSERSFFGPEILRASLRRERKRLVSEEKARRARQAASAAAPDDATEAAAADAVGVDAADAAAAVAAPAAAPAAAAEAAASNGGGDPKKKKSEKRPAAAKVDKRAEKQREKEREKGRRRDKRQKGAAAAAAASVEESPTPAVAVQVVPPTPEDVAAAPAADFPADIHDEELPGADVVAMDAASESADAEVAEEVAGAVAAASAAAAVDTTDAATDEVVEEIDEEVLQHQEQQPREQQHQEQQHQEQQHQEQQHQELQHQELQHQEQQGSRKSSASTATGRGGAPSNLSVIDATSCDSVMSNISETEDSYRRVPAGGEVEVSVQLRGGSLAVVIHQCRGLSRIDGRQPNPYVKTYLLPDKTKRSKRRTHARRGTCNPTYGGQPLVYPDLAKEELDLRTLQISAWHSVPLGANIFMGEVRLPMEQCHLLGGGRQWLRLSDRLADAGVSLPTLMYQGDLALSIRFDCGGSDGGAAAAIDDGARGRLEVWVRSCSKLGSGAASSTAAALDVSPYIKSYLLPDRHQSSKRKSKVIKSNPNPGFNAMFTYNGVSLRELRERSVELTVWDHVRLGRNDFLGGVRLNVGDNTRHPWMDARGHEQTLWTGMLENPNKWIDGSLILRPNMDPLATHIAS